MLGTLVVSLLLNVSQFLKNMKLAGTSFGGFATVANKLSATVSSSFAASIAVLTAGLLAFFKLMHEGISLVKEFQLEMSKISTLIKKDISTAIGGINEEMARFSKEVLNSSFIFGESTTTVAKGLHEILSAAFPTSDAMIVLNNALRAARAGFTTTDVSTNVLITTLLSYNLKVTESARVTDLLFETVRRGVVTFEELAPLFGRVSSTAAVAGVSLEELLATISTLTRAGLQAPLAISSINQTLKTFLTPSKEARIRAAELGLNLDATTLSTEGLLSVMEKMKDLLPDEIAGLFREIRALRGVSAAIQQLAGFHEDYNILMTSSGATQEAFLKAINNMSFRIDRLREGFKVIMIEVFLPLAPIIEKILDAFQGVLNVFQRLSPGVKGAIGLWGSLTAVIGALAVPLLIIVKVLGGAALIAFGKFLLVLGAVVAALVIFSKVLPYISSGIRAVIDWFANLYDVTVAKLTPALELLEKGFKFLVNLGTTVSPGLNLLVGAFKLTGDAIAYVWGGIKNLASGAVDTVKSKFADLTTTTYEYEELAKKLPDDIKALTEALDNAQVPADEMERKWRAVLTAFEKGVPITGDAKIALEGLLAALGKNAAVTDDNKKELLSFLRGILTQIDAFDQAIARLKLSTDVSAEYRTELTQLLQKYGSLETATTKTKEELITLFTTLRNGVSIQGEARRYANELSQAFIKERNAALVLSSAFETLGSDPPAKLKALASAALTAFGDVQRLGHLSATELRHIWVEDVIPKITDAYGAIPPQFAKVNEQVLGELAATTDAALRLKLPIRSELQRDVTERLQSFIVLMRAMGGKVTAELRDTWTTIIADVQAAFGKKIPDTIAKSIQLVEQLPADAVLNFKTLNQDTTTATKQSADELAAAFFALEKQVQLPPERAREIWKQVMEEITRAYGDNLPAEIEAANNRIIKSQEALKLADKVIQEESIEGIHLKYAGQYKLLELLDDEVKRRKAIALLQKAEADDIAKFEGDRKIDANKRFALDFQEIQKSKLTRAERRQALLDLQKQMEDLGLEETKTFEHVGAAIDKTYYRLGNTTFRIVADSFRQNVQGIAEAATNALLGTQREAQVSEEKMYEMARRTGTSIESVKSTIENFARANTISFEEAARQLGYVEKKTYSVGRAFQDLGRSIIQTFVQVLVNKAVEKLINLLIDLASATKGGGKAGGGKKNPLGGFFALATTALSFAAEGGAATRPTLTLIGEKQRGNRAATEALIPLDDPGVLSKLREGLGINNMQPSVSFHDHVNFAGAMLMMDNPADVDRVYRNVWLPAKRRYATRLGRPTDIMSGKNITPIE